MQRWCNDRSAHWTPAVKHDLDIFIYCSVFMCGKESHTSLTRLPLKLNFILMFVGTFKGKTKHSCEQKSYCGDCYFIFNVRQVVVVFHIFLLGGHLVGVWQHRSTAIRWRFIVSVSLSAAGFVCFGETWYSLISLFASAEI